MTKLKLLSMHKLDDVPDHIIEEMKHFSVNLSLAMIPCIDSVSPNIALSGISWTHCAMIKRLVTEDPEELRKAVRFSCKMLLENMEILIDQMQKEDNK